MTQIDRGAGSRAIGESGISHKVVVVYGLPRNEMKIGGNVVKLSDQAGMELGPIAVHTFQNRGHRVEEFRTRRLILQKPDSNLTGIYLETEEAFVSSQEANDPKTGRGSGRFETTIFTTQERIEGLEAIRNEVNGDELLKAA